MIPVDGQGSAFWNGGGSVGIEVPTGKLMPESTYITCRILSPQNLPCSVSVSSQVQEELLHPEHHTVDSSRHRKGWVVLTERKTESPDGKVKTTFHRFEHYKAIILPEREQ